MPSRVEAHDIAAFRISEAFASDIIERQAIRGGWLKCVVSQCLYCFNGFAVLVALILMSTNFRERVQWCSASLH